MEDQTKPVTIFMCGPSKDHEHDFSGWTNFNEPDGTSGGTAVCTICGKRAIDEAMWND